MSAQHTQGSIRYDYEPGYCGELIAQNGATIASFADEPSEPNARRLVACWNYCEDLDTEGMEMAVKIGRPVKVTIDEGIKKELDLLAQRDELLARLEEVDHDLEAEGFSRESSYRKHIVDAIAKVKGGTA